MSKTSKCKFKVGDKVRVRSNLKAWHDYKMDFELTANCTFTSGMAKLSGKIVTIKSIYDDCRYCINESDYYWVDEMFEPICKFKVGDYVVVNRNFFGGIPKGTVGKVTGVDYLPMSKCEYVGFETKNQTIGMDAYYLDLYTKDQPTKIVITTDGKITTAKMYRDKSVVKVETTKCHPDDRFDFMVGARVAFDRLVSEEKEEPKYYNGKVVCVDNYLNEPAYTIGKIYQMVDGQLIDDRETIFPTKTTKVKSFKEWCEWSTAKWLEVVE